MVGRRIISQTLDWIKPAEDKLAENRIDGETCELRLSGINMSRNILCVYCVLLCCVVLKFKYSFTERILLLRN